jgi:hypothetical protein
MKKESFKSSNHNILSDQMIKLKNIEKWIFDESNTIIDQYLVCFEIICSYVLFFISML